MLAIGRRGSPRKLNVQGEQLEKVTYRLIEPEMILDKDILVVGGGDSAIESAILLADQNRVTLSYRSAQFNRLKPKNNMQIIEAVDSGKIKMFFNSQVQDIRDEEVALSIVDDEIIILPNDLVFIFAGGELPTQFLEKSGIEISKRFNYTLKSHKH